MLRSRAVRYYGSKIPSLCDWLKLHPAHSIMISSCAGHLVCFRRGARCELCGIDASLHVIKSPNAVGLATLQDEQCKSSIQKHDRPNKNPPDLRDSFDDRYLRTRRLLLQSENRTEYMSSRSRLQVHCCQMIRELSGSVCILQLS